MKEAVIVSIARTPVAKYRGDFANMEVPWLAGIAIQAAAEKINLNPENVDFVILGNLFASDWGNVARSSILAAGFPLSVPGITIDHQCSSSLNAAAMAASYIQTGMADVVMACGVESYSQWPHYIKRSNMAFPNELQTLEYKPAIKEYGGAMSMIMTAENMAVKYGLTREECDEFALRSHLKAAAAWEKGYFDDHVVPVTVKLKKDETKVVKMDACVRKDVNLADLAKLRPPMKKDGIVTAGNSSPMNDGSSAMVIMSRKKAEEYGLEPLAVIREFSSGGCDPTTMGEGPIYATRRLMSRFGYKISDFDLVELNEAFAAQSIPCIRELGIDLERVNVDGGAIAIGHPNGASGGILVGRLVNALRRRGLRRGLVTFCCGGGQGFSLVLENPQA